MLQFSSFLKLLALLAIRRAIITDPQGGDNYVFCSQLSRYGDVLELCSPVFTGGFYTMSYIFTHSLWLSGDFL